MANDRETSKQRRARENRARREALAARTTPRPSRAAPAATSRAKGAKGPVRSEATDDATADAGSKGAKGAKGKGRPLKVRPPRPGDVPVDIDTLEGSFLRRLSQVPGGSQVVTGVLVTVLATVLTVVTAFLTHSVPPEGVDVDAKDVTFTRTAVEAHGVVLSVVPPVVILFVVLITLGLSLGPHRRRAWTAVALFVGLLVVLQGAVLYLFTAGMFGYAAFRASKVEGPNEPMFKHLFNRGRKGDEAIETTGAAADDD